MSNYILELQKVSKDYKNGGHTTTAVKDITYHLPAGESLAVIGPSGSGKSTLLNLIGGLDVPTRGKVIINEQDISKLNDKALSQFRNKTIGFVFQFFNLQDYLHAYENVMIPMLFSGISHVQAKEKAHELLKSVGLEKRANYYPKQLSGGEMQRVAIARSLANDPKILLADEPTANLDKKSAEMILETFDTISKRGVSLIVITHDNNVSKNFKNILHISNGELVKE
ncbi:MAG: ABC transporter ATP-binding protein [Candidatus Dojkabacteria bacterium]|nr:MAG: ABC transporter ATP-binding protein [Candidatus Dojkabacteria bacterium]